jgi:hypothetical protein
MRLLCRVALLVTLITAGVVVPAVGPAGATEPPQAPPVAVIRTTLQVVGFDARLAEEAGYSVRTDAHGRQYLVGRDQTAVAESYGRVYGDCGWSEVYISKRGMGYSINTGFGVNRPAVRYQWAVDVYGPQGWRKTWGGGLLFRREWHGTANHGVSRRGRYTALVTSPSYAVLNNGAICQSLHPSSYTIV